MSTVFEQWGRRAESPTHRGRRTRTAIDPAAEAGARSATRRRLSNRKRVQEAAAAAGTISVSRLAMLNNDFDRYWAEMPAMPGQSIAETGRCAHEARLRTPANVFDRASYAKEVC